MLVGIWNTDWMLLEKGYYTAIILWMTFSAITLIEMLRFKEERVNEPAYFNMSCWLSVTLAFSFGIISIYNTEWDLYLKGYYWMGMIFVAFSTLVLSRETSHRSLDDSYRSYED